MKNLIRENITFISILAMAAALRLWDYWGWSYSHDELGAFIRLNYGSFSEFIREGVQNNDTHPVLTQLFLLGWTKLFGLSEAAVRLPFILAGLGSVALVFLITKKWFGHTPACFSALALALLEFPILYSQLARPYSFGLLFSLLAVWFWTRLLLDDKGNKYKLAVWYGLATLLCMLTHYFSFFFAMIVAATGFIFVKKDTLKPYLLSGILAILLFIPHISVSLHQFSMGGVGEWLAKPGKDFLWKYILYGLNDSPVVLVSVVVVSLLSVLMYHLDLKFSKLQAVCLIWFLLPFAVGYYYSVTVNPVLQYSTLLFSFPFLLIFLFSFFKEHKTRFNNITYAGLGIVILLSTVVERNYYKREQFGVFAEINASAAELQKKYGAENTTILLNTSAKNIFDFYFQQNNDSVPFDFYPGDDSSFVSVLMMKVEDAKTPYFIYGWSNFQSPFEAAEIIKRKYPCVIYDQQHFNSQVTLFGRSDSCRRDTLTYAYCGFETHAIPQLLYDTTALDTSRVRSGKHSLKIDPSNKYCITFKSTVKQVFRDNSGCASVSAWVTTKEKFDAQLVMDIGQPTGKRDWQARLLNKFNSPIWYQSCTDDSIASPWYEVFATFELPPNAFPDDEVKIHLWNPGKNTFYLDDVTFSSFADSKYDHYKITYRK